MKAAVFPIARWAALAWLAVWAPVYWVTWGPENFLLLCDVAVILTCAGLWWGNSLLLSSQAVGALLPNLLWTADLASRAFFGQHLFGGTEYMWMSEYPLWIRSLSFFHVALPFVQLWALRRTGYDLRGWKLQSLITFALMLIGLLLRPEKNLNYIYTDPLFHRAWGPPLVHVLLVCIAIVVVFYLPTHLLLSRLFAKAKASS